MVSEPYVTHLSTLRSVPTSADTRRERYDDGTEEDRRIAPTILVNYQPDMSAREERQGLKQRLADGLRKPSLVSDMQK